MTVSHEEAVHETLKNGRSVSLMPTGSDRAVTMTAKSGGWDLVVVFRTK